MDAFFTIEGIVGLLLLTMVELVLVVDNALVVILQCKSLHPDIQKRVETIGLIQGALIRVILLFMLSWLSELETPIEFIQTFIGVEITAGALIKFFGGLILMWIAIAHYNDLGHHHHVTKQTQHSAWWKVLLQILGVNLIFSLDSVLSAVGTVKSLPIMVTAVLISVAVLLTVVTKVSRFIESHPNLKIFALSIVFLIGGFLFAEGCGAHIEKTILYAAMGFGLFVQIAYMMKREALYKNKKLPEEFVEVAKLQPE